MFSLLGDGKSSISPLSKTSFARLRSGLEGCLDDPSVNSTRYNDSLTHT
jgi:hypothetical protein